MKNTWILLLLLLTINACLPKKIDKQTDLQPELAGTYQITNLVIQGTTYIPVQGVSGQVIVVKDNDAQVTLSLSLNENGSLFSNKLGSAPIQKGAGNQYNMIGNEGTQIGTIDGTSFSMNIPNLSITAKK